MKDLITSWKFWAAVIAAVILIVCTILYFTVPAFKDILITVFAALAAFAVGIGIGICFFGQKK